MDTRRLIRVTDWISRIGKDPADSTDVALQKRLVVTLSLAVVPAAIIWSGIYFLAGAGVAGFIPGSYAILGLANTALFAFTRRLGFYRFTQLLMFLLLPWLLMMSLGGYKTSSAVIIWAALCPLGAIILEDLQRTFYWLLGFIGLLVLSAILQPYLTPAPLSEAFITWFFALNIGAVILIGFGVLYYFVGQRNFFQERSEMLLLNILPKEISEALKEEHRTIANHHDAATILFADVVNFTPMAATMTPLELVSLLNEVFQCFDDLVEKYGLEKIKTIGDCYMVAAGIPVARPDHAVAMVDLALDMRTAVAEQPFCGRELSFRIGINSGPVVAGVIGRKKFIYDLWGDAVNLASRMESHGSGGAIQITQATYDLVKDRFICEPKGKVRVKGAGELEVWHVVGRHPDYAVHTPKVAATAAAS
jgi:guanylate cyclase